MVSVLESAFEMLSRMYRWLQQLQQLAMLCNKVGSVTLQHWFSSFQHRTSLKTGPAALHIPCGRSVKFMTQGQATRSGQLTLVKKNRKHAMATVHVGSVLNLQDYLRSLVPITCMY